MTLANPILALRDRQYGQVGSLDALRTIAVLLVISNHVSTEVVSSLGRTNAFSRLPIAQGGWMGVDLFFVLSGYLIGKELWKELKSTGNLNWFRFVLRRGLRIWPLYFSVFLVAVLLFGRAVFPWGKWWSDLIFLTNYINKGVVPGSWSLCTEEQFYALAPLCLLIGVSYRFETTTYLKFLIILMIALPLIRALVWLRLEGTLSAHSLDGFQVLYQPSITHADGLVIGLIISYIQIFHNRFLTWSLLRSPVILILGAVALLFAHLLQREVLVFSGLALLFGSIVAYCVSGGFIPSFVNWWVFYFGSRLSFGMYLNQGFMIEHITSFLKRTPLLWGNDIAFQITTFLVASLISALVAVVTFCLIEHPFLELRKRWLTTPSPGIPLRTEDVVRTD